MNNPVFKYNRILLDPQPPMGGGGSVVADISEVMPSSSERSGASVAVNENQPSGAANESSPATVADAPVNGDDKPFSFEEFKKAADKDPAPVAPTPVAPVAAPAPKPATPIVNQPAALPAIEINFNKPATPATNPVANPVVPNIIGGRDYTGLNQQEVEMFKKMGNETFAHLLPVYKEHQQLKLRESQWATEKQQLQQQAQANPNRIPESYYEHPEAVTLTPLFKQTQQQAQYAQFENNHWGQQLEALRGGNKVRSLIYDGQTGKYNYGQELEPNAQTERLVMSELSRTQQWQTQVQQQAQQIVAGYQQSHQQFVGSIKQAEKQYFPMFEQAGHPYEATIKQVLEAFPESVRTNNPLAPLVAKGYALCLAMQDKLNQATKAAPAATVQQQAAQAGPTNSVLNTGIPAGVQGDDDSNLFGKFLSLKNRD